MKVGEWWASQLRNLDEPPPTPLPPRRPKPKAVPRRTKSMPSTPKYMMPTENMGEYDSGMDGISWKLHITLVFNYFSLGDLMF